MNFMNVLIVFLKGSYFKIINMRINIGVWLFFISFLDEMCCLRVRDLQILPVRVQRGGRVILQCLYELQGDPLYCVKWYRGQYEFYRFSPEDRPSTRVFPFSGINVDLTSSNATQVVLQRVDFALSGNFSCEVSADEPSFSTGVASGHLEVVSIPQGVPIIVAEHSIYDPGDILRANCTAPPSRPGPNVTLLINNNPLNPGLYKHREVDRGLLQAQLSITVLLLPEHFREGPPIIRCTSKVLNLYSQSVELHTRSVRTAPRLERVTSSRATLILPYWCWSNYAFTLILMFLIIKNGFSISYECINRVT